MEEKNNFGPHLIVVPNAVLVNWKAELNVWLPGDVPSACTILNAVLMICHEGVAAGCKAQPCSVTLLRPAANHRVTRGVTRASCAWCRLQVRVLHGHRGRAQGAVPRPRGDDHIQLPRHHLRVRAPRRHHPLQGAPLLPARAAACTFTRLWPGHFLGRLRFAKLYLACACTMLCLHRYAGQWRHGRGAACRCRGSTWSSTRRSA